MSDDYIRRSDYELKPCPFCGSTDIRMDRCTLRIRCNKCYANGQLISRFRKDGRSDLEAAVLAWNTRAYEDPEKTEELEDESET